MSQIDSVTLGEEASVVADCDAVLYASAKEVVWSNALIISDASSLMLKLTVDMDYIRRLRIRSRVALMSLAGARAGDSQLTGPELFWMCVNDFLFSEAGREFRLPMGSAPIHRTNSRGRIMCRTGAMPDRYHPNAFVNSLMLCLLNVCNVAHCVGWVPIYVNYSSVTAAMRLMRNREKATSTWWMGMGYRFADFFYASLLVLVCGGLVRGEVRRMMGHRGEGSRVMSTWFYSSALVATNLGLLESPLLDLGVLCVLQLSCYVDMPVMLDLTAVSVDVPRFIENPTAFMEKMWYLQDFLPLVHHCCYCRYGDKYRKPTTYWISGFRWAHPLVCTPSSPCEHFAAHGCHAERIGGDTSHSMAQKWSVPFELCLELLQCMVAARPSGRWFITLFGGQGSFDRACRMLGLLHVSVSFDRPSGASEDHEGCVHVWMDLKSFSVGEVMRRVWHLTGLAPGDLVGIAPHPGCETFSSVDG
jgi:hypothetical protein